MVIAPSMVSAAVALPLGSDFVATVSPIGLVTAHAAGTATIVAATDDVRTSATIVVLPRQQ